jgi:hypothetical protein
MLILKVYVNKNKIDEVWIHNTGVLVIEDTDLYDYRIRKPEGYDHIPIYHSRKAGWAELSSRVLFIIREKEQKEEV